MINSKYNIYSKLKFDDLPVSSTPIPYTFNFTDDNSISKGKLIWTNFTQNNTTPRATIELYNGNKVYRSTDTFDFITLNYANSTSPLTNDIIKLYDWQIEFNFKILTFNYINGVQGFMDGTNKIFYMMILNNRLSFELSTGSIPAYHTINYEYEFKENIDYNIVLTKKGNIYSLMVNGLEIGKCTSSNIVSVMRNSGNWQSAFAQVGQNNDTFGMTNGYIWGINMTFGGYELKYNDSFTKYGDKLTSYLNFSNNSSATSFLSGGGLTNTQFYTVDLEAKITPRNTWTYGTGFTVNGSYLINNTTTFVTNINSNATNKFTNTFRIRNNYNVNDIELVNLGGGYKVLYTYTRIEPTIIVNANTTSALDFENGIIDKVGTTVWTKQGTGDTSSNRIYGNTSFETKAANDGLLTNTALLTGGNAPYTIEFNMVHKGRSNVQPTWDMPIFNKMTDWEQGMYLGYATKNLSFYRDPNFINPIISNNTGSYKILPNENVKVTLSYDGAALRTFVNDKLDKVIGTNTGFDITHENGSYRFFDRLNSADGIRTTTYGLIDNINIFDGVANKTKTYDVNDSYLKIYIPFEGADNSTSYVNNGTSKGSINLSKLNAADDKLTVINNFVHGYSAIALPSNQHLKLRNVSDNSDVVLNVNADFTISVETNNMNLNTGGTIFNFGHAQVNTGLRLMCNTTGNLMLFSGDEATAWAGWKINWTSTQALVYGYNKFTLVRKGNVLYLYVNDKLWNTFNVGFQIDTTYFALFNLDNSSGIEGFAKNFRFYEGVAIIPTNNNGKAKLEFDNNLNDSYNNSTWTNNSVTFDNVKSVKGYSGLFANSSGSYAETTSTNITNLKDNDFSFKFDINNTSFLNFGEVLSNAQTPNNNNSVYITTNDANGGWRNFGINLGASSGTYTDNSRVFINTWYNDYMAKRNRTIFTKRNGVLISTNNIADGVATDINGAMRIGKPSNGFNSSANGINGNVDNFEIVNDDVSYRDVTVYNGVGVTQKLINNALLTKFIGTPSADIYNTVVLNDSPLLSDFICEADIFIKTNESFNNHGGISFRTTDFSRNNMDKFGYCAYISGNVLRIGKGSNVDTAAWTTLGQSPVLGAQYMNDKYHKLKVVANGSNFKVYLDDVLQIETNDGVFSAPSKIAWFTYLTNGWTNVSSSVKSIKISTLTGTELLYKDFSSKIDVTIDNAALNLPLESLSTDSTTIVNIGYTPLTITGTTPQSYQNKSVNGRKCLLLSSGRNITITNNNIFNFGTDSEFYFSIDFYPVTTTRRQTLITANANSLAQSPANLAVETQANGAKVVFKNYLANGATLSSTNAVNYNAWNRAAFYRKEGKLFINLNGTITEFINQVVDFTNTNQNTIIGAASTWSGNEFVDYLCNVKLFNGTGDASAYVDDKRVIDVDFKPTNESYLFKDNFNKCVLHPVNMTQRDYQDSQYCANFNGTDQFIQLGSNPLLNFGNDSWMIQFKFKLTEYINTTRVLLGNNVPSGSGNTLNSLCWIGIMPNNDASLPNTLMFSGALNSNPAFEHKIASKAIPLNQMIDAKITYELGKVRIFINGKEEGNNYNLSSSGTMSYINFNGGGNTFIGKNYNGLFNKMNMYRFRAFRNTTDMSLFDDDLIQKNEIFKVTNGTDTQTLSFTDNNVSRAVKVIADTNKLTLDVDGSSVFVNKTTDTTNLTLFNGYRGDIRNIKLYDDAFYDSDTFVGSELVDADLPEIELIDDNLLEYDTFDLGDFIIDGFIEGYTDHEYRIQARDLGVVLVSGVEDYYYNGFDFTKIDEYEIYDLVTKQSYPLYNQPMIKGYIYGKVNVQDCANNPNALEVRCFRSDNKRFIGAYKPDSNGDYNIPNLDVNAKYDLILVDTARTIEQQVSSYRTPLPY